MKRALRLWRRARLRAAHWTARTAEAALPRASISTYLLAVILLATLPLAALLTYNVAGDARKERERTQALLVQAATAFAQAVDQEFLASTDALDALARAGTPLPARPVGRLPRPQWHSVFLLDGSGRQVWTAGRSARGWQAADRRAAARAVQAGQPVALATAVPAQEILRGTPEAVQGGAVLALPVGDSGAVLGARLASDTVRDLLGAALPPPGGSVMLYDSLGVAVAGVGPAVAHAAPPASEKSGAWTDASVMGAWQNAGLEGWRVEATVPVAPIARGERDIVLSALVTLGGSLLLGVTLALLLSWRIAQPLERLARGRSLRPAGRLPVREVAQLRDALLAARERDARAHHLLQTKAREFEALFNSSPIGLAWAHDVGARRITYNPAMERLLGPAALQGTAAVEVLCRGERLEPGQQPLLRACLHGEEVRATEMELHVDGRATAYVVASAVPLLDAAGARAGAISAVMDITELRQAVALWLAADERGQEAQGLIDLAQEAGHVGFIEYRFGRHRLGCSSGMLALLRAPADAPPETLRGVLACIHPDDRAAVRRTLANALAEGGERLTLEYRVARPAATEAAGGPEQGAPPRWLSSRVRIAYRRGGRPASLAATTVEITEQKEAERAGQERTAHAQAARLQAEADNRAKDAFVTMLSHELRNPLGAISAAAEVLDGAQGPGGAGGGAGAEALAVIQRQTRRLTHMVGDLLEVGRVATGKVRLVCAPLELAALVESERRLLQLRGELQQHTWDFDLEPVWVHADATRLEQVVSNLLGNAVRHVPAGGRIRVTLRGLPATRDGPAQAQLRVQDSGPGIAPQLLPHIFDLFVQGERPLDRSGAGLGVGLTLVRQLVQAHGGRVSVHSASGEGTCFTVLLPVAVAPAAPPTRMPATRRGKGQSVLIVDDNADLRETLRLVLERNGHRVSQCGDGPAGLERLLRERPDAAVVDIGLPGLDGFAVSRAARRGGYAGRLVAITGYGQASTRQQALRAGFDVCLFKPVQGDALRAALAGEDSPAGQDAALAYAGGVPGSAQSPQGPRGEAHMGGA